jgi:hypothetical protein
MDAIPHSTSPRFDARHSAPSASGAFDVRAAGAVRDRCSTSALPYPSPALLTENVNQSASREGVPSRQQEGWLFFRWLVAHQVSVQRGKHV